VDTDEVATFNRLAAGWWDSTTVLHTMNRLRIPLVRDAMVRQKAALSKISSETEDSATPLKGMTVLDVGCGGGILSEVFLTATVHNSEFYIACATSLCVQFLDCSRFGLEFSVSVKQKYCIYSHTSQQFWVEF